MEQLKSLIPNDLKRLIGDSTSETLTLTCSSLIETLLPLPQFQRVIGDLTDPELALCRKSKEKALDFKKKGNDCFSKGDHAKALSFYSQALRYSPMSNDGVDEDFVAMLYVNRASSMHKMSLLEESLRDCDRAIALSPAYAKAWYRRGKANASLKKYEAAICDFEISLIMESSSSGKKQIKQEINEISNQFNGTSGKTDSKNNGKHYKVTYLEEQNNIKLQCVTTPLKGRGMVSPTDIPPASLLHREEPVAAIVMKSCRETRCHFCFNELPADVLFCLSCTIPIYCSQHCQERAGGKQLLRNPNLFSVKKNLPTALANHVMNATLATHEKCELVDASFKHIPEHRHECGGAHWSAILPPDVVLAGRVMVKFKEKRTFESVETLELTHNYETIPSECKLELHLYAIVLSYCLQRDYDLDFPSIRSSSSELVLLIAQIKVNCMAIVRMKSPDGHERFEKSTEFSIIESAFTSSIEQIQVGKAIYATGSLFNHSCQPNIHAYFLSRTLFLRSTEFVPAWDPLELSYGPQVGQSSYYERQEFLKERYSFRCQCNGCSELNLSDIVICAYSCLNNCLGAILDMDQLRKFEEAFQQKSIAFVSYTPILPHNEDISKVAYTLLQKSTILFDIAPAQCLNCGLYRDLKSLRELSESAMMDIKKLKERKSSTDSGSIKSKIFRSLRRLRSVRHPYSKIFAQAEDIIAEVFVKMGEFEHAMLQCKASVEILEKLYGASHIVIGHELLKLVSIQLCMGDHISAQCNILRLWEIFELYYGSHATTIFPYLDGIRGEVDNLNS